MGCVQEVRSSQCEVQMQDELHAGSEIFMVWIWGWDGLHVEVHGEDK
jgi:hypothetical protein